jgi:hypothetical protein
MTTKANNTKAARGRKPQPKRTRARVILNNMLTKNGVLPERQAAIKLLVRRLEVTKDQASTYFNTIRKEVEAA